MTDTLDVKGAKILIVDDTPANLDVLCGLLEHQGYDLAIASDGALALKIAAQMHPDLILLDIMMPGMDGFEVCQHLKRDPILQSVPVIFVSARDRHADIMSGFRLGGVDYIVKPFQEDEVLARIKTQLSLRWMEGRLHEQNERLERQNQDLEEKNQALEIEIAQRKKLKGQLSTLAKTEAKRWGLDGFVGQSSAMRKIYDDIRLLQESPDIGVLIAGESGTGKELIARAIHVGSARGENSFIPVNCASMPTELAESLLFGHEKGSFTGAQTDRVGYFEMAHEGTLFLDELGEMPLDLQAKLLRVLEDGQVWRIGAQTGRVVDVRVIAATNTHLQDQLQDNRFRQDLYFRIARFTLVAPPLRERKEDIALLTQYFLKRFATEMGREVPTLHPMAEQALTDYAFPGNVRELKNIVERALIESRGGEVRLPHLHFLSASIASSPIASTENALITLEENERRHIQRVLEATEWVIRGKSGAAAILDLPESTLRGRMRKLGLARPSAQGVADRASQDSL